MHAILSMHQIDTLCNTHIIHLSFLVDFYLTIHGLIQFTGIVLAFVPGVLLDWYPGGRHRNFSIILSFVLTGLISILVTVGLLIPVLELQVKFNSTILSIRILGTATAKNCYYILQSLRVV